MDLLVVIPSIAWGVFLAYVLDLVTKKPDREWETFVRYAPVRWFVSPNGNQIGVWTGALLLICAVLNAWLHPVAALVGFVGYAVTLGRTRWPRRVKPPEDSLALSAFTLGLRVAADTFETLERRPSAIRGTCKNVTGVRLQSGILTVYVQEADASLEAFVTEYVRERRPDLPTYVVVETPPVPDPHVM